jgi:hypothetical protein
MLNRVHTVKPVGSPFSSPLGLHFALRLLTSPSDHLSYHLVAVHPENWLTLLLDSTLPDQFSHTGRGWPAKLIKT